MSLSDEEIVKRLEKLTLADYVNNGWEVLDDGSIVNKNSTTLQLIKMPDGLDQNCNVLYLSVAVVSNKKIGTYMFGAGYIEINTSEIKQALFEEIKELIITPGEIILENV